MVHGAVAGAEQLLGREPVGERFPVLLEPGIQMAALRIELPDLLLGGPRLLAVSCRSFPALGRLSASVVAFGASAG